MLATFVRRPVLAAVISIFLVLLGLLSLRRMPMTLFPSIAPPEVNVTVEYTGANAETVTKAAIVPLERAINGVPGMKYMSSDAGNDGVGVVQVLFETGTDPDVAAINVQNRVNAVIGELPVEVVRNGVKIAKEENAILLYLSIFSDNEEHDEKFLYNFADINVLAELKRINGVGFADIIGAKEYAIRIWLKPERLAAYDITPDDVLDALEANNVEAAPGKIGENSDRGSQPLQYTLTYAGKFTSPEEYGAIPIRSSDDGEVLRVRDVADVELGTTYFDVEAKLNGRPAASIMMKQLPGSNASEVIAAVKERMATIKAEMFLPGMDYEFSFDVSRFLDAAVREVRKTLIEAFVLVALVVFVFLRDWRSTLVPVLAVPVSLVGTLAAVLLLGFSLNLITLFALVLAIGIVVDNAIVVVEAVHAKMHDTGLSPYKATQQVLHEIGGAVIAITLVMTAVFVPVTFMSGPVGVFYREFSITMAVSIVLSGVMALSLTPVLCGMLLKKHDPHHKPRGPIGWALGWFNRWFDGVTHGYVGLLKRIAHRWVVTAVIFALAIAGIDQVGRRLPSGFIPAEDQGMIYAILQTPPGSTLERTFAKSTELQQIAKEIEGVESVSSLAGYEVLTEGRGSNAGTCLINLKNWSKRKLTAAQIIAELEHRCKAIAGVTIEFYEPPAVPGYGAAGGFSLRLLDKTATGDYDHLQEVNRDFMEALGKRKELRGLFTFFSANYPQLELVVDNQAAMQKGVSVGKAMDNLSILIGSTYEQGFIKFGQFFKLYVQADPKYRRLPKDLNDLYVANEKGEMVPYSAFVKLQPKQGLNEITRYNAYPAPTIQGAPAEGYSSGDAIKAIQEVAAQTLPRGYDIGWAGLSFDEVGRGNCGEPGCFVGPGSRWFVGI